MQYFSFSIFFHFYVQIVTNKQTTRKREHREILNSIQAYCISIYPTGNGRRKQTATRVSSVISFLLPPLDHDGDIMCQKKNKKNQYGRSSIYKNKSTEVGPEG
jgi:hypothetical protein